MNKKVEKIRHHNTEMLRNKFNTITEFAESIGKNKIQVSSWLRKKRPRLIGNVLARDIEASAGKPNGWLDKIHSDEKFEAWEIKDRAVNICLKIEAKALDGSLPSPKLNTIEEIVNNV